MQGYPPRELAGDEGLLPGAGPGGSLSSSALASPSTRSLSMSFSWSFISLVDRSESRFVDIRSLSTLDRSVALRWKNVLLLDPRSGLALPERESTLPPEPPSRVFSSAGAYGRRAFSLGLRLGDPFRFSGKLTFERFRWSMIFKNSFEQFSVFLMILESWIIRVNNEVLWIRIGVC